jgi:putative two-component system response regulator
VEKKNLDLLTNYNDRLNREVAEKTRNIEEIQEKLVLSMADMVENRDGNTGGHVRRTSDVVGILVREIMKYRLFPLDENLARDIIRTAPMHDLGKIAVPDAILTKAGKFEPDEYEIMKTHAAEGARIVDSILEGTEDISFHKVAVNVAHYHHERWDGSGYPEKLKGEEIPIEARIMAIADVYDALVSKRVYKDKFSFEDADKIMMESFVKHFDKRLEKYYVAAKPRLEEYYSNN